MPEVDSEFARVWVEFADPSESAQVFRCDLTWLTSSWTCIFGSGCQGIDASQPDAGCCTLGAHFADDEDEERVAAVAVHLTGQDWQRAGSIDVADRSSWVDTDDEGARKTRAIDGACVFLNRSGFTTGSGCALHGLALRLERHFVDTKPDVCWQLPIRRAYRNVTRADETEYLEVTITEYERSGWGPGGHDLDWYCSANTEAHVGLEPVFVSNRAELTELMGPAAYAELAAHCSEHLRRRSLMSLHPASAPS